MSNSPVFTALQYFARAAKWNQSQIDFFIGLMNTPQGSEMESRTQLQEWLVQNPENLVYGPYLFDLLLTQFIFQGSQVSEEFFETEEWESLEEAFAEEGSELLNLLLYLAEAVDTDAEISLDDYLDDFLLVDEDEFQDEHEIYREVILLRNQIDSAFPPMMEVLKTTKEESPLGSLFIPLFVVFYYPNEWDFAGKQLEKYQSELPEECAVFSMIEGFLEGLNNIPVK